MQVTRRELLDEFLRHVGDVGDTTSRLTASDYLNRAIRTIWLAHAFRDHRLPSPVQVSTIASQRTYVLPQYFGRFPAMTRQLRNLSTGGVITVRNQEALEAEAPTMGSTLEQAGAPRYAFLSAPVGVSVQPTGTQALEVVSDSASDTDIVVQVEGLDSTGAWNETQVTLAGTSAVALGSWQAPLITFSKAYPYGTAAVTAGTSSRGTVTLRVASAGATLQTLLPEESAREFPTLTLYPKPSASGELIALPCIRAPKRLLYDTDEIPRYWTDAVLEEMAALWREQNGEAGSAADLPRPHLLRLIAFDNTAHSPDPVRRVPFAYPGGGMGRVRP
ncbi:MAG: hypothetical protein IT181_13190 [Acidobacteria bacterium]|nr:hypothetical protein [Acidobacteriota bacterium]